MAKYKMQVSLLSLSGPLFIIGLAILLFAFGLSQKTMNMVLGFSISSLVLVFLAALQIYIAKNVAYEINDAGLKITSIIGTMQFGFSEMEGFRMTTGSDPYLFSAAQRGKYSMLTHRIVRPALGFETSFNQPVILIETSRAGRLTQSKNVLVLSPENKEQFIAELKKRNIPELK